MACIIAGSSGSQRQSLRARRWKVSDREKTAGAKTRQGLADFDETELIVPNGFSIHGIAGRLSFVKQNRWEI
jgi:RecB family exonuclease